MARTRRRTPARNRKGQFKKGRKNASPRASTRVTRRKRAAGPTVSRRRALASRGRKPAKRRTTRRSYRRTGRRNKAVTPILMIAGAAGAATLAARYVSPMLSRFAGPVVGNYGTTAALAAVGWWLTRQSKEDTKKSGYAIMGIAFGNLAVTLVDMFMPAGGPVVVPVEGAGAFVPRSAIVDNLPPRVAVPQLNPIASIVVPG